MTDPTDVSEKYVCRKCIQDPALKEVVDAHAEKQKCSYCTSRRSALLEYVTDRMRSAIGTVYGDLEDNLDRNGQVPDDHTQIEGVLDELEFHVESEELMRDIVASFGDRSFIGDRETAYLNWIPIEAWRDFQVLVKHKRRYTFASVPRPFSPEMDELLWSPANLLKNVARTIHELGLIIPVDEGTAFWRLQVHERGKIPPVPSHYTSPPTQFARFANRMSPAGIPMFYGSDHFSTALLEVSDAESVDMGKHASGIVFRAKRTFPILDLTRLPKQVSFFADWDEQKRRSVGFLRSFVQDVSKPILKDGREHIEYVPTQVFTEFVRYEVKTLTGDPLMGIKYHSSKDRRGCYVLFVEQEGCLPGQGSNKTSQLLHAEPDSLRTVKCKVKPSKYDNPSAG